MAKMRAFGAIDMRAMRYDCLRARYDDGARQARAHAPHTLCPATLARVTRHDISRHVHCAFAADTRMPCRYYAYACHYAAADYRRRCRHDADAMLTPPGAAAAAFRRFIIYHAITRFISPPCRCLLICFTRSAMTDDMPSPPVTLFATALPLPAVACLRHA